MKVKARLAVVTIVSLMAVGIARAESDGYVAPVYGISTVDSYDSRIQSLEKEIASLRDQLGNVGDCGCDAACGACDSCCCDSSGCGLYVQAEALLIAYHRADGMRVGSGPWDHVNSSFNLAPRLSIGYINCSGTGFRVRWFDYNHSEETAADIDGEFLSVDTFNLDLELFDEIWLNCKWSVELSGGYRMNNFEELMVDAGTDEATARYRANFGQSQGGIFGIVAKHHGCRGTLYAGLRGSILMGDRSFFNSEAAPTSAQFDGVRLGDVVQSIWEISIGYEHSWCCGNGSLAFIRLGAEWQQWENFTGAFNNPAPGGGGGQPEEYFAGPSDVGFGGIVASFGITR